MSASQPAPTGVEPAAREMVKAVRVLVEQIIADVVRIRMERDEGEADMYAHACMGEMPVRRLPALVAAHDNLAAALNAASPDFPPILSLTTERPA